MSNAGQCSSTLLTVTKRQQQQLLSNSGSSCRFTPQQQQQQCSVTWCTNNPHTATRQVSISGIRAAIVPATPQPHETVPGKTGHESCPAEPSWQTQAGHLIRGVLTKGWPRRGGKANWVCSATWHLGVWRSQSDAILLEVLFFHMVSTG